MLTGFRHNTVNTNDTSLKLKMGITSTIPFLDNFQTIGLCIGIFLFLFYFFRTPAKLPPGPTRWPIIGNIPTFIFSGIFRKEQRHELMNRLYKKYGKIFSFNIGSQTTVVLNDANLIREAFQKSELFGRPRLMERLKVDNVSKLGDLVNGETWTQHRRFILSVFRSAGVGKLSFDEQIAEEAVLLGDAIEQMNGKAFDPKASMMNATSNMICSIILGKHFEYDDHDFQQMLRVIAERPKHVQKVLGVSIFSRVPFVGNVLFQKYTARFSQILEYGFSFVRPVIEDHKVHFQENDCPDFIDLYIKKVIDNQTQSESQEHFKNDYLLFLSDIMFTAGTETSSNTLAWCLYCMGVNPKMQQRIRDEILTTCGDHRLPTYSDRSKMPFTEAFLLEVQRLYTIIPLGVPHVAVKTTSLRGYTIPEGSLIMANLWAVHHDPEVWSDPVEFKPTRFLDQDGKLINVEELIPFSAGRRVCLGERIAKMELFIFLTHMVRRFQINSRDQAQTMKGTEGLTYAPPEFFISATNLL